MHASDKKLNEMNRLSDMGHFPAIVNAGATINILFTVCITWWLVPRYPQVYAPILWAALVLCINLAPVILLRLSLRADTLYRPLREMDFFADQHKFSDWVYLAASANMAFWILVSWSLFSIMHSHATLIAVLFIAGIATFSPVILRSFHSSGTKQ